MKSIIIAACVIAISAIAWGTYRNNRLRSGFALVEVGSSEAQVAQLLGRPFRIQPCGTSFGATVPHCTEFVYRNSFAPIVPEYWAVRFDEGGKVLDRRIYTSP